MVENKHSFKIDFNGLASLIDRADTLSDMICWFDPDLPLLPNSIQFIFQSFSIVIVAHGEDDTIEILQDFNPSKDRLSLIHKPDCLAYIRNHILGMHIAWIRTMTNHLGYMDGVQIDFVCAGATNTLSIILIALGSCLDVNILTKPGYSGGYSGDTIPNMAR